MKNLVQICLIAILFSTITSCNDTDMIVKIKPSDALKGLSSETLSELNHLKETLGSQIAYKALSLEDKDTKSTVRLLAVAPSKDLLDIATVEGELTLIVNSSETLLADGSGNSAIVDDKQVTTEPTVYYIIDDITSEAVIKRISFKFSSDENGMQSKNFRKPNEWSYGIWITSDNDAIGARVTRTPISNSNSAVAASYWIKNCGLCGWDQRAYYQMSGDYESSSYYVGGVKKHAVYVSSNWKNHYETFYY